MRKFDTLLVLITIFFIGITGDAFAKSKTKKVKLATAGKIYVPKIIESFKLSDTKKFPQANLGVAFNYSNVKLPQVRLDYYIYPIYETTSIEHAMYAEYANIIKSIKASKELDNGIVSVLNAEVIDVNDQHAIKATINMESKHGTFISELYLTSIRGHYIKFRASYPMYDSKELGLGDLTEKAFRQLLSKTKFKSRKEHKFNITLNTDIIGTENEKGMAIAMIYGISVQAKLPKDLVDSYDDFYDIYYDTLLAMKEIGEKREMKINIEDDIIDYFDINDAGFLREFIWFAFKRPYWTEPKDLKIQEFKTWAEKNESQEFLGRPAGVDVLIER